MKPYALYTTFNNDCLEIGMNMIFSFLFNNKWFAGDIIILCDQGECAGLSEDSRNQIKKLYSNIIFKDDCYEIYKDAIEHCRPLALSEKTLLCYYKLELLKKNEYTVKVYLDADVIVTNDIMEMFSLDNYVRNAAATDFGIHDTALYDIKTSLDVHEKGKDEYFNAGVMIIKDAYIENDLYDKCLNFCINCKNEDFSHKYTYYGKLVDQDMFNELLTNTDILTFNYNTFAMTIMDLYSHFDNTKNIELLALIDEIKIIHYCGKMFKPLELDLKKTYIRNAYKVFDIYYRYDYLRKLSIKNN